MARILKCECGKCSTCYSRQHMRDKRGSFTGPQGRIPEPIAFRGEFPRVRLHLSHEDIYGSGGRGFGVVPKEER